MSLSHDSADRLALQDRTDVDPSDERVRRFRAETLEAALASARAELGLDVEIVAANRIRRGGVGGFFATDLGVELMVLPRDPDRSGRERQEADLDRLYLDTTLDRSRRAAGGPRPVVSPGSPGLDRLLESVTSAELAANGRPVERPAASFADHLAAHLGDGAAATRRARTAAPLPTDPTRTAAPHGDHADPSESSDRPDRPGAGSRADDTAPFGLATVGTATVDANVPVTHDTAPDTAPDTAHDGAAAVSGPLRGTAGPSGGPLTADAHQPDTAERLARMRRAAEASRGSATAHPAHSAHTASSRRSLGGWLHDLEHDAESDDERALGDDDAFADAGRTTPDPTPDATTRRAGAHDPMDLAAGAIGRLVEQLSDVTPKQGSRMIALTRLRVSVTAADGTTIELSADLGEVPHG